MAEGPFVEAAVRTIIAPYWKLWLARIFGKRIKSADSGDSVVCYYWRGHLYMWDFYTGERL